jgi:replicative DNA helicase|tara:strand:+ start:7917 stop:9227 length:1311 start_codon:yes stop_codon:yes gene_type:complete
MYEFSDNIQRGILYLLKNNKDFFVQISNLVVPEYFEFPVHEKLFKIIDEHYSKYQALPTDEMILEHAKKEKTGRESLSDYEDELQFINKLDTSAINNEDYFLDIVETFARREAMKSAIKESLNLIKEDRMDETEELIRKALMVSRAVNVGQIYFEDIGERWERVFNQETKEKFKTLLPSLNQSLEGGLGAKELAMVVAPPGVGKSLWLVNQSVQSMIDGKKVLYVSLEMSEDKIAQRFDSVMSLVSQRKIKESSSQLKIKERIKIFQDNFEGSRLIIKEFPTGTVSVNSIRALLIQLRNYEDFIPDVIVVDYLELLRPIRENQHEYQAQQRISEELRGLAMEMNILMWTATQTNRLGRSVRIITDAELGDSYGKIRTCDFAISLNQTDEEFEEGLMRAYVIKSRNGRPRFVVPVKIDYGTLRMEETDSFEADTSEL